MKETSSSSLKIKNNSILDLYFELFVSEIEDLLRKGLIKKYIAKEGNLYKLKGRMDFAKQISKNLIHQERFYVNYTHYDVHHLHHCILYKALKLIQQLNSNTHLKSRIGALLLSFPEMEDLTVSSKIFNKITYGRKNSHYKKALEIAKLILLNFHPDVTKGNNNVLALMFDMNSLWEQFVYAILKRKLHYVTVVSQISRNFWESADGEKTQLRPDIVLYNKYDSTSVVLDTKWKNLNGCNPSPEDLRQMYAYHDYFQAQKVALIYPGVKSKVEGFFINSSDTELPPKKCSVIQIDTDQNINIWKENIVSHINDFIG